MNIFPKTNDMDGLKELALSFLYLDIQETQFTPIVVMHPFTNTGTVGHMINGEIKMLNLVENDDDLNTWHEGMSHLIQEAKKPYEVYFLINKPYALAFVKYAQPYLSQKDFSHLLSDAWVKTEMPNSDSNFTTNEFVKLFRVADKTALMEDSELEEYIGLSDKMTIYRGVKSGTPNNIKKLSWTLDYDKAEWFAKRFDENGLVYEATIKKENILALFNRRGESEVIVDPRYLMNITPCEAPSEDIVQSM